MSTKICCSPLLSGGEIIKGIVKAVTRDQKGAALTLLLVLLVVGGVILTPLLGFMSTGLISGQLYERKTDELYAADAGVEDAIWRIRYGNITFNGDDRAYLEPLTVNDKSVDVIVARENIGGGCNEVYKYEILSTAASDDGSNTTVDAHLALSYLDLSSFLDYAIVSGDTIDIQPGNSIDGSVYIPDADTGFTLLPKGTDIEEIVTGEVDSEAEGVFMTWPEADDLCSYYFEQVESVVDDDPGPVMYVNNLTTKTIGPLYREGGLDVYNEGDPDTLTLNSTVYIAGDLTFRQPSTGHNYTIDLNGHTIFAEGGITFQPKYIGLSGSGSIIALGVIDFKPIVVSGSNDFVFVLSIADQEPSVEYWPSGNFTGCIAGIRNVQLQPGCSIDWIYPGGEGLDIPMGVGDNNQLPPVTGVNILSWEIS